MIRDPDVGKDIVQDVVLKLLENHTTIQIEVSLFVYLKRMVINASLNYLQSRKKLLFNIPEDQLTYQEPTDETSIRPLLEKGLQALSPKKRSIFILHRLEGLDHDEIAEHLGISRKTVENQLSMALSDLREFFRGKSHLIWML